MRDLFCERCDQKLDREKAVWLEVNSHTDTAHFPSRHEVPPEESQGLFAFGSDCAKRVMARGGKDPFRKWRKR